MNIFENLQNINFTENDDYMFCIGDVQESFEHIEKIISKNKKDNLKYDILKNMSSVIGDLVYKGSVYERLVLDTAQLYILKKISNIEINNLKEDFGEYAIMGAEILSDFSSKDYLKNVFENKQFLYLSKIKIADYIFELKQFESKEKMIESEVFKEVLFIKEKYGKFIKKELMNELSILLDQEA